MVTEAPDAQLEFEIKSSVYRVLSRLFSAPPDRPLLEMLQQPEFLEDWPWGRGHPKVEEGLARLHRVVPTLALESLTEEYRELFFGPGPVLAPPWESVYLDREHVVFGEDTLKVRALFRRFGLESRELNREPDDQIGLQLQFLAQLAHATADRVKAQDLAAAISLAAGQRECIEQHLLRWLDQFAERVFRHGRSDFYKGAVLLVHGTLETDCAALTDLTGTTLTDRLPEKED